MGTYERQGSTLRALLILAVAPTVLPDAVLTSSLDQVCPGKSVTFTCTTTGSSTLAWQSNEYIGAGSQFEFRSIDNVGASQSNSDAVATLIATNTTDGMLILTSTLRVVSRPNTPNVRVSCRNVGLGRINTSMIPLAAVPEAPQNVRAAETTQPVDSVCIILVTWVPPASIQQSDIDHYTIYVSSGSTINETTAIAILRVPNCRNNDIRIRVTTITHFGCVGQNSSEVQPILLTTNTQAAVPTNRSEALNVTPEPVNEPGISAPVIAAIFFVCVLFLASVTILVIAMLLFFKARRKKQTAAAETDGADGDEKILDIPATTEARRKEYQQMEEQEEDIMQIILEDLDNLYEVLKAETDDKNSLQKAVKQLNENLKKRDASGHIVRKALWKTVKTLGRKELRRALDTLKNSVDISSVSGGMNDIVRILHTATKKNDHEFKEAINKLEKVLKRWAKSDDIKACLQTLCDKLMKDESQLNTTEVTYIEDSDHEAS